MAADEAPLPMTLPRLPRPARPLPRAGFSAYRGPQITAVHEPIRNRASGRATRPIVAASRAAAAAQRVLDQEIVIVG